MAKNIKTVLEKAEQIAEELEVELVDEIKHYSGIVINGLVLGFTEGKAIVSNITAETLKKSGFIK